MPDMPADPAPDPTAETGAETGAATGVEKGVEPGARTTGHRLSAGLTVGGRVVVRRRLEEGAGAGATDVLGRLVSRGDDVLVVDTASERVTVLRADIVAAKEVPPRASRRGPAHERVSVADLQRVMAAGWVAVEQHGLGEWLLRASSGFTGRASSVLPVGDPSLPLDAAIDYCERWYTERGARPLFQLPGEHGFDVEQTEVGAALLERGYAVGAGRPEWQRVLVMTGLAARVPPLTTESVAVTAEATLSPEWLMAYGQQREVVPGATEAVLTGSAGQLFLSVRDEATRRLVGIARMAIHPGWAGVFGLWVHPDHRRSGIATAMTSAMALVAGQNAMPAIYAQVTADNSGARAMYESFGFGAHHDYTYLSRP